MGTLQLHRRKSRVPQVGDMRILISIHTRAISEPNFNTAKFSQQYTPLTTVWAKVDSVTGKKYFSGVQLKENTTEFFTIRYRDDITSEKIIEYDGKYFEILDVLDPEKRKRFLFIQCKEKGATTKKANW